MSNSVVSAEDNVIRPIVPIRIINNVTENSCLINCMIDTGADRDVISFRTVKRLNLDTKSTEMRVITVDNEFSSTRELASFTVESINGDYSADVKDALVGNILTGENDVPPSQRDLSSHPHLTSIPFDHVNADVEMIIGAAHTDAWMPLEIKRGKNNDLAAMKSALGWTIVGRLGRRSPEGVSINAISAEDEILRKKVDRIFYHDFAVVDEEQLGESKENVDAIKQLAATVKFDESVGKYSVGLPWNRPREEIVSILNSVNSRDMAMRRLKGMISRFRRDPERKAKVFAEVQKFVDTNVAVEIDGVNDDATAQKPRWYLPLHVVEKGGKTRVCHDARSAAGGVCLNDFLLGGPNLVNPLAEILMYARIWKFIIMNDIKAFFHQIRVDEADVDAFRFPWFCDESMTEAKIMNFLAHVFGSGASSVATAFVLRYHADQIRPRYPENVHDMIRRRYYVDDGTGGANTEEETVQLSSNVNSAMAEGGFQLCKFKSNLPQIMEGNANAEVKLGEKGDDEEAVKVLGVSWIPASDVFTFNFDPEIANKDINTPRELTSVQSSIYDPLGLISPFRLPGRHMLQRCGAQKNGWDSKLEPSLQNSFQKWARSIPELAKLKIPRWWNCGIDDPVIEELHVFADAAPASGFGAAAYRRVMDSDGTVKVILLCSRSHVVPLDASRASHHNSTPRLELTASEKAVELRLFVQRSTEREFTSVTMWSDSEACLKMINDTKSRFRLFFANRLSKIHASSTNKEWRYVDSANNPADYTSRGIAAHEADKWEIFHYGPKFLYQDEKEWPVTNLSKIQTVNLNAIVIKEPQKTVQNFFREIVEKCPTWYAKKKRIVTILLIAKRWRESVKAKTRASRALLVPITAVNLVRMDQAEKLLIKEVQREHFGHDIDTLTKDSVTSSEVRNPKQSKSKSLRPHNPFVDEEGILRVGSRLIHADLQFETKFPIILPPKDKVVISIIRHYHQVLLHSGPKQTLTALREKYWINKGLQSVKSTIFRCVDCQKLFKAPLTQKMAPLPMKRVTPTSPFQNSGVDLAGPFEVKMNGRANHKVWISIFTCCATRAVHAEIVYKLDADSMINAITRFSSRRPGVTYLISDRGTNLVGANALLRKEMESWNSQVNPELRKKGVEWEFIPAGTPHYGGFWERIVALFKKHIMSATRGEILHIDVFNTIVIESEGIINKRPLTASSDDPKDTEAISPAHILYPATFSHSSAVIIPEQTDKNGIRLAWQRAQSRINSFWKSWSAEYLSILHQRSKWQKTVRDLQVDDLVIIVDETVKRHEWKMARVITVHKKENHVRKVTVIRGDGKKVLKDRNKLVLLELSDDQP